MTLTVLFALAASVFFGGSDYLGGVASRRDSAFRVTATSQALGGVLLLLAASLMPGVLSANDVTLAAVAGVSGGIGVIALYGALASGRMSVVAPVTAALSGAVPACVDFIRGTSVLPHAVVGILLAIAAVVVVSAAPDESAAARTRAGLPHALALAIVSGLGFGGSILAFSFTAPASGLWPLVVARVVSLAVASTLALARTRGVVAVAEVRGPAFGAGILDAAANVAMISAIRLGPLAVAAVLSSLYPVVVVLLARSLLGERLSTTQRLGVALALVAVILTASA